MGAIIATSPDRIAYGIDVWLHNQSAEVATFLHDVSPTTQVTLLRANTFLYDSDALSEVIDNKPVAFASVDGSHETLSVERDLTNVARLLRPGGIIAVGGFLNPLTLGVTEGVIDFMKSSNLIEPICCITNKLFVTTAGWSDLYRNRLRMWFDRGAAATILGKDSVDWSFHITHFLGRPVLTF